MTYETPHALRMALEQRLLTRSTESGMSLDRLRRRVLVDLVILVEHRLLEPEALSAAVRRVWAEREEADPPKAFPSLPGSWPGRYERLAADHGLRAQTFPDALSVARRLWDEVSYGRIGRDPGSR